jgi:hypothetical protein
MARKKFAKLTPALVKRTVAKPCTIPGPDGPITTWHITEEEAA